MASIQLRQWSLMSLPNMTASKPIDNAVFKKLQVYNLDNTMLIVTVSDLWRLKADGHLTVKRHLFCSEITGVHFMAIFPFFCSFVCIHSQFGRSSYLNV